MNRPVTPFYDFGPFRVDTADYRLFRDGVEVPLAPKVFETLLVLLEKPGQLVSKDELMERVWAGTFVGDDALAQKISLLRKALDNGNGSNVYISTVPKLGYRFAGEVSCLDSTTIGIPTPRGLGSGIANGLEILPLPAKRNRWLMAAVALGILCCVVGAALLAMRHAPVISAANYRISELNVSNFVDNGVLSPDGNHIAYVAFEQNGVSLWVRPIASEGKGLRVVAPMQGLIGGVSYSPDVAYLYYTTRRIPQDRGVLFRINSLGGTPQRLLEGIAGDVQFDPSGQRIVFKRFKYSTQGDVVGAELVLARPDGTDTRPIAKCDAQSSEFYGYYWTLDGKIVYSEAVRKQGKTDWYLVEISANGGAVTRIAEPRLSNLYVIRPLSRSETGAIANDVQTGSSQVWVLNWNGDVRGVTNDT
ncbi:MAG: winged helix-turn-helix domain-containing protein, partial [Candidatus Acidiferrales bacterium]